MADLIKISDSTSTTSSIIAASLTAVKSAMDKAVEAYNLASSKLSSIIAGTGISVSGNTVSLGSLHSSNSTIGSSSAQTLAYSGTFTIPYVIRDVYGRVSDGRTRTITMPAAPSGGTATAISNVICFHDKTLYGGGSISENRYNYTLTLPSGGTWRAYYYYGIDANDYVEHSRTVKQVAGGQTISGYSTLRGIAIRVA